MTEHHHHPPQHRRHFCIAEDSVGTGGATTTGASDVALGRQADSIGIMLSRLRTPEEDASPGTGQTETIAGDGRAWDMEPQKAPVPSSRGWAISGEALRRDACMRNVASHQQQEQQYQQAAATHRAMGGCVGARYPRRQGRH